MSKIEITKEDLKKPDQFKATMDKVMAWILKNPKVVLGGIAAFLVFGLSLVLISYLEHEKEVLQQEKYFLVEKKYAEQKRKFDEATRQLELKKSDKNAVVDESLKTASGDLTADYGTVVHEFEGIIANGHGTRAAQMAALHLSNIYVSYGKKDEAYSVLEKITHDLHKGDSLKALLLLQKGNILVDQDKCADAQIAWQKIVADKGLSYAHDQAKLRTALCFEKMNEPAKAEAIYKEIVAKESNANADFTTVKEAQKYLRLLNVNKTVQ